MERHCCCIALGLCLWIAAAQARSVANNNQHLWTPTDMTRDDWMKFHGFKRDKWERTKRKLLQLKLMVSEGHPEYDISSLSENMTDARHDLFDKCIWLTEEQLDEILKYEQSNFYNGYDRPNDGKDHGRSRQKRKVTSNTFSRWSNLPIKWKFDGMHNEWEKSVIRSAFQHWMDQTCVRFQEVPTVQTVSENHVLITKNGAGCYSFVGKIAVIPQQLNLQSGCVSVFGTVVHEIGHTLGLWHEQQRSDRDGSIKVLYENIGSYVGQFYKYRTNNMVPYDIGSVMHYGPQSASKNGKITMEALDPEYQPNMGQRTGLSFLDSKIINYAYCNATCSTPLPQNCRRNGYQDPNHCDRCKCPDGFSGTYCQDVAPSVNASCGGEVHVYDSPITITSPGYNSPEHRYKNYQMCSWLVKAPANHKLVLTFVDDFGVYCHNQGQCHHWIEVRHSTDLGLQGPRFCCHDTPTDTVTSDTDEMMLVFKTNWTVPWASATRGFKARIVAVRDGNAPPTTTTTTTTPTPTTTTAKRCAAMDLAFAIDASGSIENQNWSRVTAFISRFVARLTIGQDCVRVSVVTFGDEATLHFDLRTHSGSTSLRSAIEKLDRRSQSTDFAGGIAMVRSRVFGASNGDRHDAPNACVLITDGSAGVNTQNARNEATSARDAGISMYTVGIGSGVDSSELTAIAGGSDQVIILNDFAELEGDSTLQRLLYSMPIFPKTTRRPTTTTTTTRRPTTTTTTTRRPTTTTTPTTTTSSNFKWQCTFEDANGRESLCGMEQSSSDQFDWTLRSGRTPSSETGPNSAHGGSGYYIFIEASNPRRFNDKAMILLPSFGRGGTYCLSFYYNMNGFHINELRVIKRTSSDQQVQLWSKKHDQGQMWFVADVTVDMRSSDQLAFIGIRGREYSGDLAIDSISVSPGSCT
ncbi:Zinc metalloproteinase dpy-31 [Lamellibrachia satsuma]|nr:Zinc metalloproteinase dpy-31 [Lamellibrachia satsuma]